MRNVIRNIILLATLLSSVPAFAWGAEIKGVLFMDRLNETNMIAAENLGDGKYRFIHLELVDGDLVIKSIQTAESRKEKRSKAGIAPAGVKITIEYRAEPEPVFASKLDNPVREE